MLESQTISLPAEDVPVVAEADVVIAGGGTSGFIAATAAARTGATTLLVDRLGYLGGCTTAPYNTGLSGFNDAGTRIIGGIPWEFLQRMEADGQALLSPNGRNQLWPVWTRKVALDMAEEAGVQILLHTQITNVLKEGDMVRGMAVHNKAGRGVVLGKTFVDCTGDADIAAYAGAPFDQEPLETLQQVSCDYIACGVDFDKVRTWAIENKERLGLEVHGDGEDPRPAGAQGMLRIIVPNKQLCDDGSEVQVGVMPTIKLCVYRDACRLQGNSDIDPLDPWSLTESETQGLRGALEHLAFMAEQCPGFENAYLAAQTHLGVRETRRIIGDYVVTREDLESQCRFDDVVCLNSRGLDFHLKGTVFKWISIRGHHDIPLRALLPQNVENMVVAGRCISSDHDSQASLRGAGACMGTGHAAGTTAALAAKNGCRMRSLNIRDIQSTLIEQGAILRTEG